MSLFGNGHGSGADNSNMNNTSVATASGSGGEHPAGIAGNQGLFGNAVGLAPPAAPAPAQPPDASGADGGGIKIYMRKTRRKRKTRNRKPSRKRKTRNRK